VTRTRGPSASLQPGKIGNASQKSGVFSAAYEMHVVHFHLLLTPSTIPLTGRINPPVEGRIPDAI
jgi:hypothetical protein